MKVGDEKISVAEFNFNYNNNLNELFTSYGSSLSYFGLDPSLPIEDQQFSDGTTWGSYFRDSTTTQITEDTVLYAEAMKEGFTAPRFLL